MNSEGKLYKLLGEQAEKVEKLHLIDKRINKIKGELKSVGKNGKGD
jgi:hypothetical protein